jgi:HD superfamily phosphodiesterase
MLRDGLRSAWTTKTKVDARTMNDKDKIQKLEDEVFWLKTKIKVLRERNKELRQWIVKLTNKDHPARKSAK